MSAVLDPAPVLFRSMRHSDIHAVMQIERAVYRHPWSEAIFHDCLTAGYHGVLASMHGELVAYAMMTMAAGEAHLLNLCVALHYQRQGVGRQVLGHCLQLAQSQQAATVYLEVRASNRAAQGLYQGYGFNEIGFRPHYYPGHQGREDALVFAKALNEDWDDFRAD